MNITSSLDDIIAIIPARLGSTRLARKPLQDLGGKSLIERVYQNTCKMNLFDSIYIATDSSEILEHCESFGASSILTSPSHPSGTSRIFEALQNLSIQPEIVVNIQGDEPFLLKSPIENLVQKLKKSTVNIGSLYYETNESREAHSPDNVKVVLDIHQHALYFSRSIIPFPRHKLSIPWKIHMGVYAFKNNFFNSFKEFSSTHLEEMEKLEQLKFLYNGENILMEKSTQKSIGVDTLEDLKMAHQLILKEEE